MLAVLFMEMAEFVELFLDTMDLAVQGKSEMSLKRLGQRLHNIYSLALLYQVKIMNFYYLENSWPILLNV